MGHYSVFMKIKDFICFAMAELSWQNWSSRLCAICTFFFYADILGIQEPPQGPCRFDTVLFIFPTKHLIKLAHTLTHMESAFTSSIYMYHCVCFLFNLIILPPWQLCFHTPLVSLAFIYCKLLIPAAGSEPINI